MSINIRTDFMQHAELFGNPVLFTNWLIQRDTIPKDWYCYDLRGTRQSPNVKIALVDKTARYHAGTVLSPTPLKRKETASRRVNSAFHLLGEEMTLEQFCEEHSLEYPQDDRKFAIKAASFDEAALFYAMTPEEDQRLGCIGHVRMDFGHQGQEFWHTWWPRGPEELNSPEFKAELQEVVDELRTSVLKDLASMTKYCWGHGGEVGGWPANYGYIVETENYRYCLRCNPVPGDYQAYVLAYMDEGPSILSCATRLLHHLSGIFQEQASRGPVRTVTLTDRKLRQRIREKKMAMGHKPDDHEDAEISMR